VRVTEPDGRYVRYEYDVLGRRTLMADGMGAGLPEEVTHYAYDALGRLAQVTDPQGGVTGYIYDADGNLTTTTLPNGVTETDTYDAWNRVVDIVARNRDGATISSFAYTLDANGNRTREDDADGSYQAYTYDALDRVTAEEHFNSDGVSTGAETYVYDAVGNVIARTGTLLGGATFDYNGDNQQVSGAGLTYLYDGAGNLVSVTDSSGKVTRYSYDARGRLISSQAPDEAITSYTYDFQGVRQSQQGPGGLVKYLVDAANGPGSAQVVRESDSTGATLRSYVIGTRLLSFTEGGNPRYYLTDGLGSTRLLTDRTGAVTDTYLYSAYGVLLRRTGGSANPFLFAGEQQDATSGLLYLRARYYDPATDRFVSPDAFPGFGTLPLSLNKYLYSLANPTNDTDPSGNVTLIELQIVQAAQKLLKAYDAVSTAKTVLNVVGRTIQAIGGVMTEITAREAYLNPAEVGGYFGGRLLPLLRPILGRAVLIPLVLNGTTMIIRSGKAEYLPAATGTEPGVAAYTYPDPNKSPLYRPDTVFLGPLWFAKLPLLPEGPLDHCRIGTVIHEWAHLASRGKIRDTRDGDSYGELCLYFPALEALRNADNYRLAVQGVIFGADV
jgi:RHS repeat-associated protein